MSMLPVFPNYKYEVRATTHATYGDQEMRSIAVCETSNEATEIADNLEKGFLPNEYPVLIEIVTFSQKKPVYSNLVLAFYMPVERG